MTATMLQATTKASASRSVTPTPLAPDHSPDGSHIRPVGGNHLAGDRSNCDAHEPSVSGNLLPTANPESAPKNDAPSAALLALAAASLDDMERTRISMANRIRAMRDDHGLAASPEYDRAVLILEALEAAEHQSILELQRAMRKHPLGPWVKRTVGIGEKQGARLLAALDDPYWNHAEDRPRRGPAELWAYCGLKPGQRRQKGVRSNWNADAKMRARLCAESCIKQMHSPYRADYDRARENWADRDTSDLHKHNHALHVVAKAILRDMWREGKEKAS